MTSDNFIAQSNLGGAHADAAGKPTDNPSREAIEHWKVAANCFAEACRLKPDDFSFRLNYAETLMLLGRLEEAEREGMIALPLTRARTEELLWKCLFLLGDVSRKRGQFLNAVAFYEDSLKLKDSWNVRVNLCLALDQASDRTQEAIDQLNEAVRLAPDKAFILGNLGTLHGKRGEWKLAAAKWQDAVALEPNSVKFRSGLAESLIALGQTDAAKVEVREALRLEPGWAATTNRIAWTLATHPDPRWRQPDSALRLSRLACLSADPTPPEFLDTMAVSAAAAGEFDLAVSTGERAIEVAVKARRPELASAISDRVRLYRDHQQYAPRK